MLPQRRWLPEQEAGDWAGRQGPGDSFRYAPALPRSPVGTAWTAPKPVVGEGPVQGHGATSSSSRISGNLWLSLTWQMPHLLLTPWTHLTPSYRAPLRREQRCVSETHGRGSCSLLSTVRAVSRTNAGDRCCEVPSWGLTILRNLYFPQCKEGVTLVGTARG